jgi:hypothetical protein
VPELKTASIESITQKGVEVSLTKPYSLLVISAVAALLAVISVTLNTLWQPHWEWFSVLVLIFLGWACFKAHLQATAISRLAGALTHLVFKPCGTLVKTQTGQMWSLVINSVWWHAWGFTLVGTLQAPGSHSKLTCSFTVWRSKNTPQNYRWASICLSNQVRFSHNVKAA